MTTSPFAAYAAAPTPVYGEIYSADGQFWAEIILEEDGIPTVVSKSNDFANREQAVAWLAANDLYFPPTLWERLQGLFGGLWQDARENSRQLDLAKIGV